MPKYEVSINETISHTVRVWAEDTDVAIKKAYDIITNDSTNPNHYEESVGLDQEESWVEEIEGDD